MALKYIFYMNIVNLFEIICKQYDMIEIARQTNYVFQNKLNSICV